MHRHFWISLIVVILIAALARLQIQAQDKKDQPKELTNRIGMKLVFIPPGKFLMGSPLGEKERQVNEIPHEVEITKGFWLGKYEVTQEEYENVMGTNPSHFKGSKRPVEQVSWNDAKEFCKNLSAKEGKEYTLPTEAEWEYACRAGTKGRYSTKEDLTFEQARYAGGPGTVEVGSFAPNGFGLFDVHGNVWEWCEDWFGEYDEKGLAVDPKGPAEGSTRVFRGGSHFNFADVCRSACRGRARPAGSSDGIGFRIALRSVKTPDEE